VVRGHRQAPGWPARQGATAPQSPPGKAPPAVPGRPAGGHPRVSSGPSQGHLGTTTKSRGSCLAGHRRGCPRPGMARGAGGGRPRAPGLDRWTGGGAWDGLVQGPGGHLGCDPGAGATFRTGRRSRPAVFWDPARETGPTANRRCTTVFVRGWRAIRSRSAQDAHLNAGASCHPAAAWQAGGMTGRIQGGGSPCPATADHGGQRRPERSYGGCARVGGWPCRAISETVSHHGQGAGPALTGGQIPAPVERARGPDNRGLKAG